MNYSKPLWDSMQRVLLAATAKVDTFTSVELISHWDRYDRELYQAVQAMREHIRRERT